MTQTQIREWLFPIVSGMVLLLFIGLYGQMFTMIWQDKGDELTKPEFKNRITFATTLSGVVGAIVAAAVGLQIAQRGNQNALTARSTAAATVLANSHEKILTAYAGTYLVVAFAAIWTWLFKTGCPDVISSLATSSIGFVIGVVQLFLKAGKPE